MHMVRNKEQNYKPSIANLNDIFAKTKNANITKVLEEFWWQGQSQGDWKTWSSNQWSFTWGKFLNMDGAMSEPSFNTIKTIYESVLGKSGRQSR